MSFARKLLIITSSVFVLAACQPVPEPQEEPSNTAQYEIVKQCSNGAMLVNSDGSPYVLTDGIFIPVATGADINQVCP